METLDFSIPEFYSRIAVTVKTLLTYPVSTCTAERSFSSIKGLKTPLRSAMPDARLSSLSIIHIQKHKEIDLNEFIFVFCWKERRTVSFVFVTVNHYIHYAFRKALPQFFFLLAM